MNRHKPNGERCNTMIRARLAAFRKVCEALEETWCTQSEDCHIPECALCGGFHETRADKIEHHYDCPVALARKAMAM